DFLHFARGPDRHRELATPLQHDQAPRLNRIQATSTRGVRARIRRVAGCAPPTGFAGHAGATANLKLTFHLDHSAGLISYLTSLHCLPSRNASPVSVVVDELTFHAGKCTVHSELRSGAVVGGVIDVTPDYGAYVAALDAFQRHPHLVFWVF